MDLPIINQSDPELIRQIAVRAGTLKHYHHLPYDRQNAMFDILLCHLSLPLDLEGLLEAGGEDFAHDVLGIRENLNRQGDPILKNGFTPRFTRRQT